MSSSRTKIAAELAKSLHMKLTNYDKMDLLPGDVYNEQESPKKLTYETVHAKIKNDFLKDKKFSKQNMISIENDLCYEYNLVGPNTTSVKKNPKLRKLGEPHKLKTL